MVNELRAASRLQLELRYQRGSLLDLSPSPLAAPALADTPMWIESEKGRGIATPIARGSLNYGAAAKLDFGATGAFFCAFVAPPSGVDHALFRKMNYGAGTNGYCFFVGAGGGLVFQVGDAIGNVLAVNRSLTPEMARMRANTWCVRWTGGQVWADFNGGNVVSAAAMVKTPTPAGQNFIVGRDAVVDFANPSPLLELVASNTFLTAAESARLYSDWLRETYPKDLARRGFVYKYPSKNATEYAAAGIALDTDFGSEMNGTTRRIRDLTNNYPGTITGVVIPGQNGEGQKTSSTNDGVDWGAFTPLNSAAYFSLEHWLEFPAGNIAVGYIDWRISGADGCAIGNIIAAANPQKLAFRVINGTGDAATTTAQLRGGTRQHLLCVFNGPGATNPEKGQVYIDGESVPLTFASNFPATTANLAARQLYTGQGLGVAGLPATHHGLRFYSGVALTPTQARAAYVNNFAKKLLLRETLEDVPVSLVASVGAGGKIGPWDVIYGTWKCSETSDGKRWLECVTAGDAVVPIPDCSFGTHTFYVQKHQLPSDTRIVLGTSRSPVGTALAGSNGYCTILDDNRRVRMSRYTAGIIDANLWVTANNFYAVDTTYQFTVARRVSDGRFQQWIKGGAYTVDTTTGGPAADATYTGLAWLHFQGGAGDKLCLYDPRDPTVAFSVYQGCLNPTMGELPSSVLLNMLRYSEQFDNALWTKANLTVTPNVAASPFGTPSVVDLLTATAGASTAVIGQSVTANPAAQYTQSVYTKASVGTAFTLHLADTVTGECSAVFNPATGALTTLTAGVYGNVSAGSEALPGGWWRYWISGSQPAAQTTLRSYTSLPNNADAIYYYAEQLVQGPCAGAYRETQ